MGVEIMPCSRDAQPRDGPIHCGSTSHAEDPNERDEMVHWRQLMEGIGYQVCDRKSRPGLLSTAKTRSGNKWKWKQMSCSRDAKCALPKDAKSSTRSLGL